MQVTTQTKYAFKSPNGSTIMLVDDMEHAKRWYKNREEQFGPLASRLTLHEQTITETNLGVLDV